MQTSHQQNEEYAVSVNGKEISENNRTIVQFQFCNNSLTLFSILPASPWALVKNIKKMKNDKRGEERRK